MIPDPLFGEVCAPHVSGCGRCGAQLTGRRTRWCSDTCRWWWYIHHRWRNARKEAMRRARGKCLRCGKKAEEVDHIIERKGQPIHQHSCLHHQTNLRALCHDCHVARKQWHSDSPDAP